MDDPAVVWQTKKIKFSRPAKLIGSVPLQKTNDLQSRTSCAFLAKNFVNKGVCVTDAKAESSIIKTENNFAKYRQTNFKTVVAASQSQLRGGLLRTEAGSLIDT